MDCTHFQANVPNSSQLGTGLSASRIDICELLSAREPRHEEFRAALLAEGFKLAHPLACPVAAGGRWKACPLYGKPPKRGHRRR